MNIHNLAGLALLVIFAWLLVDSLWRDARRPRSSRRSTPRRNQSRTSGD